MDWNKNDNVNSMWISMLCSALNGYRKKVWLSKSRYLGNGSDIICNVNGKASISTWKHIKTLQTYRNLVILRCQGCSIVCKYTVKSNDVKRPKEKNFNKINWTKHLDKRYFTTKTKIISQDIMELRHSIRNVRRIFHAKK